MGKKKEQILFNLEVGNKCNRKCTKLRLCDSLLFRSKTLNMCLKKKCDKKIVTIDLPECHYTTPAQFHNNGLVGSPPITPGQPFTFSTNDIASHNISFSTGLYSPPFTSNGTVFLLKKRGIYQIFFQTNYQEDAAILLYTGSNIQSLTPLSYTLTGKTSGDQIFGSYIINAPSNNYYLSLVASPNNVNNITIPLNSSSNNLSNTSISINQLTRY